MEKIILSIAISGCLFGFFGTALSEAPLKGEQTPKTPTTNDLIALYADKYNVSRITLHSVIKCESQYRTNAVGDYGHSYGLVQIHLPSHPEITKAQALDSDYAINFLAKSISLGKGNLWTCYRKLST